MKHKERLLHCGNRLIESLQAELTEIKNVIRTIQWKEDSSISKVIVKDSTIEIIGLFKKQIIDISEIQQSKAEGYQVFIYFKNGKIQKMPSWFGSKRGFQQVVNNKIKKLKTI